MAADRSEQVTVVGLRDLNRALKQAGEVDLAKGLQRAQKAIAEEVVDKTRARAASLPGLAPRSFVAGLRATATRADARVTLDSSRAPTIFGDEFGSRRYRQFQPWRGNQWDEGDGPGSGVGYALYPTIRADAGRINERYRQMIDQILAKL